MLPASARATARIRGIGRRWRNLQEWEKLSENTDSHTPDLYRVNFEVNNLKPFPYLALAFPHTIDPKKAPKLASFDGELMGRSSAITQNRPMSIT
jgi:hypothetical protein